MNDRSKFYFIHLDCLGDRGGSAAYKIYYTIGQQGPPQISALTWSNGFSQLHSKAKNVEGFPKHLKDIGKDGNHRFTTPGGIGLIGLRHAPGNRASWLTRKFRSTTCSRDPTELIELLQFVSDSNNVDLHQTVNKYLLICKYGPARAAQAPRMSTPYLAAFHCQQLNGGAAHLASSNVYVNQVPATIVGAWPAPAGAIPDIQRGGPFVNNLDVDINDLNARYFQYLFGIGRRVFPSRRSYGALVFLGHIRNANKGGPTSHDAVVPFNFIDKTDPVNEPLRANPNINYMEYLFSGVHGDDVSARVNQWVDAVRGIGCVISYNPVDADINNINGVSFANYAEMVGGRVKKQNKRKSSSKKRKSPTKKRKSPTKKRKSPTKKRKSPTKKRKSPTKKITPTKKRKSPTKKRKSPTKKRTTTKKRTPTKKRTTTKKRTPTKKRALTKKR